VDVGQPFQVVIDFAHTPAALTACLTELRQRTLGQLLVVFGSAGDQDTQKRPMLGCTVSTLADLAIVTSEDPRSECQANIAESILDGVVDNGAVFETIHERRAAIARAFELADPGDLVLLAGKGHERSIVHATYEESWDELQVAVELLGTLGYTKSG
jgi:UDP-N-acetylmuramoyl-L-alanyl-D-glutamate--2,6-diaminopimelate ligase